ncbi:peptide ABC transporter ATPase [Metasolibacillus meyeri]|uniref:Peptide ABC transporter ATPase n=1 Tax=Metasolibacillus meyeri TaxID=1071052 RepID=A0AAW9NP38_9BACL|nr:peptide ABC transporter ATPase [Metasolibacillus meyeri]MEC1177464.1 peptide ABC transporter ATPase [Metasolibacillus meyeri]
MNQYTYQLPGNITATEKVGIINAQGEKVAYVARIYSNRLKRFLDGYFDYRYFLTYEVTNLREEPTFRITKKIRRGKLWFEAFSYAKQERYTITYENWRIGLPELAIHWSGGIIKIDKQMEGWSHFLVDDEIVARWQAVYVEQEDCFHVALQIEPSSPIQQVDFFVAISQAALFIGS